MRFPLPTRTDRYLNNYLDTQSEDQQVQHV